MKQAKIFYYHFKIFNFWLLFNCLITYILVKCAIKFPFCWHWKEFYILISLMIISWSLWGYKHLTKHILTIITNEFIKIDHCEPLYWKDVKNAEERIVRCFFRKLKVIIINPKNNINYRYNFLQKHNGGFTPFSLPLYPVVTEYEANELRKIISSKVKYKQLPNKKKINRAEEILAEQIHKIWSRWFLHYSKNASPKNMRRWTRLAKTPYNKLPETEKEKDREILREILSKQTK